MPAHLPSLFGRRPSERGLWLGWKYVHAGGVHEICVIPECNTDEDKTRHGMVDLGLSRAWHFVLQEASLWQVKVRTNTLLLRAFHSSPTVVAW